MRIQPKIVTRYIEYRKIVLRLLCLHYRKIVIMA